MPISILNECWSFLCRGDSSDYEDILCDIDDNIDTKERLTSNAPVTYVTPRCFPVYLGGTNYSSGCSTIGTPRFEALHSKQGLVTSFYDLYCLRVGGILSHLRFTVSCVSIPLLRVSANNLRMLRENDNHP